MTVSVALATYNGERFLKYQLDSLLENTRQPDEVVIIDDCSTDGTVNFVKNYISEHNLDWRLVVAEVNKGYRRNFYNCLKLCTGDVIFLCDQDDVWYKEKIEKLVAVFENDDSVMSVNSSFDMIDSNGDMLVPFGTGKKNTSNHGLIRDGITDEELKPIGLEQILQYNISPGCTSAFRREVVEQYIKTSECIMPHDWELNIIAASKGGLRFYNKPLIGYRQHGNNTIGLAIEDSFGPLKMRGSEDVRLSVLKMQSAQRDINKKYCDKKSKKQVKFLKYLDRFCENREKILYAKRLLPCFKNFFCYMHLRSVATIHFRGLIGDIIFVLKGKFSK